MKTIWKYPLYGQSLQTIYVPHGAELLHIGNQYETITAWFRCDTDEPTEPRIFTIEATGEGCPEPEKWKYVGTVVMAGGTMVWHVFEQKQVGAP